MAKAIALLRKSTTEENRQVLSFDRQLDIIRQRAEADGATIGDVLKYSNPGAETAHLEGALAAVQTNGTKRVYVADASRFGRFPDLWAAGYWLTRFHRADAEIVTASNGRSSRSTSAADFLTSCIEHMQSSQENRDRSARTMAGQATAARRGHFVGGGTPFGYDRVGMSARGEPVAVLRKVSPTQSVLLSSDGSVVREMTGTAARMPKHSDDDWVTLTPNPEQAPVVREIYELCISGLGFGAIASTLNERSVSGPRGLWQWRTVKHILTNPVYIGTRRWNHRHHKDSLNRLTADGVQDVMPGAGWETNDEADWVMREGAHDPIIDGATWHRAQAAIRRRAQGSCRAGSPRGSEYLLTGFVQCADCGGTFKGTSTKRKLRNGSTSHYRYYQCRRRHVSGKSVCSSSSVRAVDFEEGILAGVSQFYGLDSDRETWAEMLRAKFSDYIPDSAPDVAPLQQELHGIENRIAAVMDGLDAENIALVNRKLTQWRQETEAIRSEIAAAEAQAAQNFDVDEMVAEALSDLERLADVLREATVSEIRVVLGAALDHVEIDTERGVAKAFVKRSAFCPVERSGLRNLDEWWPPLGLQPPPSSIRLRFRALISGQISPSRDGRLP